MGLYDNNENQLSIIQQAAFNYDDHDRKRAIAERRTGILTYCLIIAAIIIIIFGLILLYIRKSIIMYLGITMTMASFVLNLRLVSLMMIQPALASD